MSETRWTAVACGVADVIRHSGLVRPIAGRSDLDGYYGDPEVYTEWGLGDDTPVMRERRHPGRGGEPDRLPCEHYVLEPAITHPNRPSGGTDQTTETKEAS